jgi:hypothetical protein
MPDPTKIPTQQVTPTGEKFYETVNPVTKEKTTHSGVAPFSELVDSIADQNKPNIVSGTDTARGERTTEVNNLLKDLKTRGATLTGGFGDVESKSEIEDAREAARKATQAMVEEAEYGRKVTLPREVLRAGERGGFESTQMAGIAALKPTAAREGEAFVGAGGQLDETRQTLDRAVVAAKRAQQEAMDRAAAAARQAIRTRRSDDYKIAKDLYDTQVEASRYADEVDRDKRDFDQKVKQFEAQEARAVSAEARAEEAAGREETRFIQENEDRFADASASALLELDKDFNVIMPTFDQIQKLAEENKVSTAILSAAINDRAEELRQVGREERADALNEARFEETKKQNALQNELAQRRIGISSAQLALSQKRLALEEGEEDVTIASTMKDTANEMIKLRDAGELTDFLYNQNVESIMELLGVAEEERGIVESEINNMMAGGSLGMEDISTEIMEGFIEPERAEDYEFVPGEKTPLGLEKLPADIDEDTWKAITGYGDKAQIARYVPKELVNKPWTEIKKFLDITSKKEAK